MTFDSPAFQYLPHAISMAAVALFDEWVRRTDRTRATGVIHLGLVAWENFWAWWRRRGRPLEVRLVFNTKTVKNCVPVEDLGEYITKVAVDAVRGSLTQADLFAGMPILSELGQLGGDYASDPAAVQQTVEREFDSCARAVIAALEAKHAPLPPK